MLLPTFFEFYLIFFLRLSKRFQIKISQKIRYELKYHNPEKYINWTVEDDKKLLEAYKRYEGQWYKIAAFEFPNRNDNACLFRYTRLMAWHRQNTWFQAQTSEIQEFILFICKQRHKNRDEAPVYTDDGELVPRKPIFAQKVSNLVDQILAKRELIVEFVEKKRRGQLSLNLLNRIGVFTPALNATILKYQKQFQQQHTPSAEKPVRKGPKTSLKSVKVEQDKQKRDELKIAKKLNAPAKPRVRSIKNLITGQGSPLESDKRGKL
jgi:hypothetical protein